MSTVTASILTRAIRLSPPASTVVHDGTEYVITTDTGERSYGRDGGRCAFAYTAEDVATYLASRPEGEERLDYSTFCAAVSPEEDRAVAIYLAAREELRLTRGGSCSPVLTDDEYALVRATVEVAS